MKKEELKQVCVVTIDSRRFFGEYVGGFLPEMYTVFGVYSTVEAAHEEVYDFFMRRYEGLYEPCFEENDVDGETLDYDIVFKRTDKEFGGVAYYGVDYHIKNVE